MKKWATGASLLALVMPAGSLLGLGGVASAQIEEVIVTARQREESLQDVPASITAFTEKDLERIGVQRAEDFVGLTPGVTLVNTVEVGDSQVNIRGLNGARDGETNFAFILDGVLYTNPSAFNREYSDLAQIEVLKGPQGALYGRSAAAGAIIATTRKPGPELDGYVELGAAEFGTISAQGAIGGGLSDTLFGRISADYRSTDGFLENSFTGQETVNDFESTSISGRLVWEPNDNLSVDTKLRYGKVEAAAIAFNASFALPGFAAAFGNPDFFENANDHEFRFSPNVDPVNEQDTLEFSIKADYDMDIGTLTSWLLYSDQEQFFVADGTSGAFGFYFGDQACIDSTAALAGTTSVQSPTFVGGTPAGSLFPPYSPTTCDGYQYQARNQEDLSFQLQLTSPGDQRLRWQTGLYLLDIERRVGVAQLLDDGSNTFPQSFVNSRTDALVLDDFGTQVFALFGSLNYDINDDVEASLALRWDREERDVSNAVPTPTEQLSTRINYCANTPAGVCTLNGTPLAGTPLNPAFITDFATGTVVNSIADRSESFTELQPKVSLSWDVNDELTLFTSWGVGFKSGGFNNIGGTETIQFFLVDGGASLVAPPEAFEKETSSAFELGFKSVFADGAFTLDGAVFNTDVDDMQFFEFFVGPFGLLRVVENIDEVSIVGAELSAGWQVTDNFSLNAGFSTIESDIDKNTIRPFTEGNDAPSVPGLTYNFVAQLVQPLNDSIDFIGRVEYSYVGDTWFHTVQDDVVPATLFGGPPADFSRSRVDGYGLTNLRLGIETDRWSVAAYSRNLFDTEFLAEVITAPEFGGSFVHPGTQRTSGIEVNYRFE